MISPHQTILAVFAHPDDEAFGPGGTLALMAKEGIVHLLCVTDGGEGEGGADLATVRRRELIESAKILGIKEVIFLDYSDGSLNNVLYHEVAGKILKFVKQLKPSILLTYEPRGISGHLDHVAVSMMTSYVFREDKQVKELWYFCELEREGLRPMRDSYFIYFPPGYRRDEVDEIINVEPVYKTKIKAMMAHESQRKDWERILKARKSLPKEECFLVKRRG